MSDLRTNIDPIRAEIMRLEDAKVFDQRAWAQVLIALSDRPNARADAARRMETAKRNAQLVWGVDVGSADGEKTAIALVKLEQSVSGHHIWTVNGKRIETWSDYGNCLRCGHKLTDLYSRQRGYGDECAKYYFPSGPIIVLKIVSAETGG